MVRGVQVLREHPVNRRLERRLPPPKEDRNISPGHSPYLPCRVEPPDLKTESVAVVSLRALDVRNRQLWHRAIDGGQGLSCAHGAPSARHVLIARALPNVLAV